MINKYKKKKIPEQLNIFVIFFAITKIRSDLPTKFVHSEIANNKIYNFVFSKLFEHRYFEISKFRILKERDMSCSIFLIFLKFFIFIFILIIRTQKYLIIHKI